MRKYDLLANELSMMYKCKVRIVPYVMTWDGIVTTYHKKYIELLGISQNIEAYIQTRVLRKTLESVSFERRRGFEEADGREDKIEEVLEKLNESKIESIKD